MKNYLIIFATIIFFGCADVTYIEQSGLEYVMGTPKKVTYENEKKANRVQRKLSRRYAEPKRDNTTLYLYKVHIEAKNWLGFSYIKRRYIEQLKN